MDIFLLISLWPQRSGTSIHLDALPMFWIMLYKVDKGLPSGPQELKLESTLVHHQAMPDL